ncbi:unnamed protein product [Adineta steineri]|uniref:Uncharacterized protein n=1 Tax=Adineta steineri TaxID=433720 RepID=A0A818KVZ4_9BILA|nr:unnamed protein product [Adineta steineri]CAF3558849.1 unnamed protein product [Adineta steineri]CAF4018081.1 unnamed protein product [Adineta steineri]
MDNIIGPTEQKHFTEQRRRSIVIDYLLAASTHGLRGVGRAYSTCNRTFWVIVFTLATGLMFYFVIQSILQYYAYPTQTKVEINLDLAMDFPAVTVCSATPNRYDKTNISLVNLFHRLYPSYAKFNQTILNSLLIPLYIDLFNRNQIEEEQSIGYKLTDIMLYCNYSGIDCSNAFVPSLSSIFGNCYTFNWKTSIPFFTLNSVSNTFVIKEGLSLGFYIPRESYFPSLSYDAGLIVLLHDNDELPLPNENGRGLQPGLSHSIIYRKTITTFLPAPYSQCTSDIADDLRSLYDTTFINQTASQTVAYSESLCRELCEQAYVFSQCSCILPSAFFTRHIYTLDGHLISANICNPFNQQVQCALDFEQKFVASEELQTLWCTRCAPQCQHTDFSTDLSAQSAPSEAEIENWAAILLNGTNTTSLLVPDDFAQRFDYYFERNYLKVFIGCGSKYVTEYKQEAKLSFIDTFSAIGGQTGLWIGLSVLSVIELIELLYRLVHKLLIHRKNTVTPMTIVVNSK